MLASEMVNGHPQLRGPGTLGCLRILMSVASGCRWYLNVDGCSDALDVLMPLAFGGMWGLSVIEIFVSMGGCLAALDSDVFDTWIYIVGMFSTSVCLYGKFDHFDALDIDVLDIWIFSVWMCLTF